MLKPFVDWFIAEFGTEFLISTEQQRQNLIERGEKWLDSSVVGYGSNHVLRGAWAAWQCLYKKEIEPANARDDLFELLDNEHDVVLLESELDSVIYCILNALEIDAVGTRYCTKIHFANGESCQKPIR